MIPPAFDYIAPDSASAVLDCLVANEQAVVLAGGHSLLTDLKQRRRRPRLVVDIMRAGLDRLAIEPDGDLIVGAGVSQQQLADFCAGEGWQILAAIGEKAGDPMIRTRGTFVGALCAAEPGGDWVAGALVLEAKLRLLTEDGERTVSLDDYLKTRAGPHLVLEARIPARFRQAPQGYTKIKHAAIGWSVASLAHVEFDGGLHLSASGALNTPRRLAGCERLVQEQRPLALPVIEETIKGLNFMGDRYAPANWRRRRLALLLRDRLRIHLS